MISKALLVVHGPIFGAVFVFFFVAVFLFVVELLLPGRRTPARSANSLQPALDQWELFPAKHGREWIPLGEL